MSLTAEAAADLMKVAVECGAWTQAIPADQSTMVKTADTIMGHALTAYANETRTEPILNLLFAGKVQPTATLDYADVYVSHGVQPPPQPGAPVATTAVPNAFQQVAQAGPTPVAAAPAPAPTPVAAPVAFQPVAAAPSAVVQTLEQAGAQIEIESIFPGYDDYKVKDILAAIDKAAADGDLSPAEWEQIKAYEQANDQRPAIIGHQPAFKAPEPVTVVADFTTVASQIVQAPDAGGYSIETAYDSNQLGFQRALQESLPEPPQWQGGVPVLPVDITQVSPEEVTRLAMQFNSLLARTTWILSQEEGRAKATAHLESDYHRVAYTNALEHGKGAMEKVTASALTELRQQATAVADADLTVKKWRDLKVQHQIEAGDLKARIAGYDSTIDRLSREQTRREKIAGSPTG